ncbi:MAG: hypothetical protein WAM70_04340 [Pyrinomonadaceae bacterium]
MVIHSLAFSGKLLQRGFWLYVWEITTPQEELLYYVGRTGDSSSSNAQSPFNRMSQHLGFNERSNVLRRRLTSRGIDPELCSFRLLAHGPIMKEAAALEEHRRQRDICAAFEKALASALSEAGYNVINIVNCRMPLDDSLFADIRDAFADEFPKLTGIGE